MNRLINLAKRGIKIFYDPETAFKKRLVRQGAKIGNNVQIVDQSRLLYEPWYADQIELADRVVLSAGVRLVSHDSSYSNVFGGQPVKFGKIRIGTNTYIGVNSIILCGVTIGENCIIGAGSVVNKDIPDNVIAAGNPVKVIGSVMEGLERFRKKIENNVNNPDIHYIDFGGGYEQIYNKHGHNTTAVILKIYRDYFDSLKKGK